jgi:hypothetical protein
MFWELHGTFPILAVAGLNLSSWWQCHYLMGEDHRGAVCGGVIL